MTERLRNPGIKKKKAASKSLASSKSKASSKPRAGPKAQTSSKSSLKDSSSRSQPKSIIENATVVPDNVPPSTVSRDPSSSHTSEDELQDGIWTRPQEVRSPPREKSPPSVYFDDASKKREKSPETPTMKIQLAVTDKGAIPRWAALKEWKETVMRKAFEIDLCGAHAALSSMEAAAPKECMISARKVATELANAYIREGASRCAVMRVLATLVRARGGDVRCLIVAAKNKKNAEAALACHLVERNYLGKLRAPVKVTAQIGKANCVALGDCALVEDIRCLVAKKSETLQCTVTLVDAKTNEVLMDDGAWAVPNVIATITPISTNALMHSASSSGRAVRGNNEECDILKRQIMAHACANDTSGTFLAAAELNKRGYDGAAICEEVLCQYIASASPHLEDGVIIAIAAILFKRQRPLHSVLCAACRHGATRVLKIMLKARADVNAQDRKTNMTPLYCAAYACDKDGCKALIKAQADVNVVNQETGMTALHASVVSGSSAIVGMLLQLRADGNVTDACKRTPLMVARSAGHMHIVKILRQNGAEDREWYEDFRDRRDHDVVPLEERQAQAAAKKAAAKEKARLEAKRQRGKAEMFEIEGGIDLAWGKEISDDVRDHLKQNMQALARTRADAAAKRLAARAKGSSTAPRLRGVNNCKVLASPSTGGPQPSNIDLVIDKKDDYPLHHFAGKGNCDMLKRALRVNPKEDVNGHNADGLAPLHQAVIHGHEAVAKFLLRAKAAVNYDGGPRNKLTPLLFAVRAGYVRIATLLLENLADANYVGKLRITPLLEAVYHGDHECVELLIENKVCLGNESYTQALYEARKKNFSEIAKRLEHAYEHEANNRDRKVQREKRLKKGQDLAKNPHLSSTLGKAFNLLKVMDKE